MTFKLEIRELPVWAPKKADVLVNIVDDIAKTHPAAPFAEYTLLPTSYTAGYRTITYGIFANIINGLAWWLEKELGKPTSFKTLAYFGGNDIRYNGLILAANKIFLTSPRNSAAAHTSLFNATETEKLITPDIASPLAINMAKAGDVPLVKIPSIEELCAVQHEHYPFNKTYEQAKDDPLVVLHTSGTTGLPKPLIWTHETAVCVLNMTRMPDFRGKVIAERFMIRKKMVVTLPPFHAGGLSWTLLFPIFQQYASVIPASGGIPSVQMVVDVLKATTANIGLLVPPFIEELNKKPELLEFLANNLEYIFFAGGDISQAHGDFVASKLPCFPAYAGTDIGLPGQLRAEVYDPSTWKYIEFHPDGTAGFDYVDDNLYEYVVVRKENQPDFCFTMFRDEQEYRNGDLFSPHPSIPNLWSYRGRNDDIIVFLTGEKHNPISVEQHVARLPQVSGALVVGAQRFQAAIMIELADKSKSLTASEKAQIVEEIWPTIEETNRDCPAHAKIDKSLVLIASHDKPFERAGKGTVQRRPTIKKYEEELNSLYEDTKGLSPQNEEVTKLPDVNSPDFESAVYQEILKATGWPEADKDANLYVLGMDSLQTMTLTRRFRGALGLKQLSPSLIFANASVNKITRVLKDIAWQHTDTVAATTRSYQEEVSRSIDEHKDFADNCTAKFPGGYYQSKGPGSYFVLTGSTGSIGSYLLKLLLEDPDVKHIYCLDRPRKYGKETRKNDRITFLKADFGSPQFGLSWEDYSSLNLATHFVHTAWPVNFNLPFEAFQPTLQGLDSVVEFSKSSPHTRIMFLSSISVGLTIEADTVPEDIFLADTVTGYASSKLVAEHVLDYVNHSGRKPITIARIGQVGAPTTGGTWKSSEWVPSLLVSSATLGQLPNSIGSAEIDWLPLDTVAEIIKELCYNVEEGIYQVVNPKPVSWSSLAPTIAQTIESSTNKPVKLVSMQEWVDSVRQYAEAHRDEEKKPTAVTAGIEQMLKANPASKLIEFYQSLADDKNTKAKFWETSKAVAASKTLREVPAVNEELISKWTKGCLQA